MAVLGLLTAVLSTMGRAAVAAPDGVHLEGPWNGRITLPVETTMRIVFRFHTRPDGTVTATMDSPDQGQHNVHVDSVTVKGSAIALDMKSVHARYEGTLSADGKQIVGGMIQEPEILTLNLVPGEAPAKPRADEPQPPYPYLSEDVTYPNSKAGITLAGTLTRPGGEGPFPAAILITGSGAQNRDEEILGHRPFLVLADYLTRNGIAVLRVDDRGVGGSTGTLTGATSADFAGDVEAGLAYLRSRSDIDKARIGLIGHSEGGAIAPMVAVADPAVAFIVLMAGPGLPGDQTLLLQLDALNRHAGVPADAVKARHDLSAEVYKVVLTGKTDDAAWHKIQAIYKRYGSEIPAESAKAQRATLLSPWFHYFLAFDPRPILRQVKCPVLAVDGTKDLQVVAGPNLSAIRAALKAGGNPDVTTVDLPNLNHLFQTAKTGLPSEYERIEETMAPIALSTIGKWVVEHTRR